MMKRKCLRIPLFSLFGPRSPARYFRSKSETENLERGFLRCLEHFRTNVLYGVDVRATDSFHTLLQRTLVFRSFHSKKEILAPFAKVVNEAASQASEPSFLVCERQLFLAEIAHFPKRSIDPATSQLFIHSDQSFLGNRRRELNREVDPRARV